MLIRIALTSKANQIQAQRTLCDSSVTNSVALKDLEPINPHVFIWGLAHARHASQLGDRNMFQSVARRFEIGAMSPHSAHLPAIFSGHFG